MAYRLFSGKPASVHEYYPPVCKYSRCVVDGFIGTYQTCVSPLLIIKAIITMCINRCLGSKMTASTLNLLPFLYEADMKFFGSKRCDASQDLRRPTGLLMTSVESGDVVRSYELPRRLFGCVVGGFSYQRLRLSRPQDRDFIISCEPSFFFPYFQAFPN